MGVVYQARDPQINRLVAVKVLQPDCIATETFVRRFLKEAEVIGRLSHPNIVTIYDVGEEQGNVYIAMEFLEGIPLYDILQERCLKAKDVVEFGIQIAMALNYAHEKGVIHRDIKPSNITVAPDGRIKITDFGIARIEDSLAALQTQTGEIMGTPAYMSPEQALGQPVDGRSDIFSLGIVLYEMTTGKRPFGGKGKTLASVFNDIIQTTPPEPYILSASIPMKLSGLIMKGLQKEPEKRFQTGKELAEALKVCLLEKEPVAGEKLPPERKKQSYGIPLVVAIVVATLAGGIYYAIHHANKSPQKQSFPTSEMKQVVPGSPSESKSSETLKPERERIIHEGKTSPPSDLHIQRPRKQYWEIEAKKQKPISGESKPTPALVPLMLRTTPHGAYIYIDENFKGTTPLTLMLSTGKHKIRVTRLGYQDVEREIIVKETMEYPLAFNLRAITESNE